VTSGRTFPPGFLWGTATAAHQVEGDNKGNDWWEFEQQPGRISNGDRSGLANDSYNRYREDFSLLREMNNNAHRLSIEWSRVEPHEGEFDSRQLRHYRDVLGELREQGMRPMLTLHHFTNPAWFARKGGWAASGAPAAFLPFVRRVVDELGDLVELWCTINEPNIYATQGWVFNAWPPGRTNDIRSLWRVLANLRQAHEEAYAEIKRRWPERPAGLVHNRFLLTPYNRKNPLDQLVARAGSLAMDNWPVAAGRLQRTVAASGDFVGLNHYSGRLVRFDPRHPGQQFAFQQNPPGYRVSDFGDAVVPEWMHESLVDLKSLGKPVYITESGIATHEDAWREDFLMEILAEVLRAIADGVDVRGFFHWTAIDNFEWSRGWTVQFGLIGMDPVTLERKPKPSSRLYARIANENAIVD